MIKKLNDNQLHTLFIAYSALDEMMEQRRMFPEELTWCASKSKYNFGQWFFTGTLKDFLIDLESNNIIWWSSEEDEIGNIDSIVINGEEFSVGDLEKNWFAPVLSIVLEGVFDQYCKNNKSDLTFEKARTILNWPFTFDDLGKVMEKKSLNEDMLPFVSAFSGNDTQDPYFKYEILPYNTNQGPKLKEVPLNVFTISKGNFVSGNCPIDNETHYGVVYKIIKNEDAEIEWIYILDSVTREFIRLDPDTVSLSCPYPIKRKNLVDPFAAYKTII